MPEYHRPVLLDQTIALLDPKVGGVFVDATLGGGGAAEAILEKLGPAGTLIGIDRDPDAVAAATSRLEPLPGRKIIVKANFASFAEVLVSAGVDRIDGALFDLGVSSHQLHGERGFSFMRDEPLDMRMDRSENTPNAADIVNSLSESQLADMIYRYGEERYARRIAKAIVRRRAQTRILTTGQLADAVVSAVPSEYRRGDIHPATRTFQAIRICVNNELQAVEKAIPAAVDALKPSGRLCVISFHSLEDRIVKRWFRKLSGCCECPPRLPECQCGARKIVNVLTAKPVTPNQSEIADNPRSRSSKLRCVEKL